MANVRKALFVVFLAGAGCGGEDMAEPGPTAEGEGEGEAGEGEGEGPAGPANDCVSPGATGNELGIGAYCDRGGDQCEALPTVAFCTADFRADDPIWTCTRLCSADEDCGSGAVCLSFAGRPEEETCVPAACIP